jgi:P4 family phage/plasmid primase-like protien
VPAEMGVVSREQLEAVVADAVVDEQQEPTRKATQERGEGKGKKKAEQPSREGKKPRFKEPVDGPLVTAGFTPEERGDLVHRAQRYLSKIPGAKSGEAAAPEAGNEKHGHDQTIDAARTLIVGFDLSFAEALPLMQEYNGRCEPPWDAGDLERKLREAMRFKDLRGELALQAGQTWAAITDGHRLAAAFLETQPRIRYWNGEWYEYIGKSYRLVPDGDMRGRVTGFAEDEFTRHAEGQRTWNDAKHVREAAAFRRAVGSDDGEAKRPVKAKLKPKPAVTTTVVNNVMLALEGSKGALLEASATLHSWIDDPHRSYVAMNNGLLDIAALLRNDPCPLIPHDDRWFSTVCLPYDFVPDAECPKWLEHLTRVLGEDKQLCRVLQEWFGLMLVADTSYQVFFIATGDGGNGKSATTNAMEAMLGAQNVSSVSMSQLSGPYALHTMIGKLANISNETADSNKVAEDRLRTIATGDPMTVERKHLPALEAVKLTARMTYLANRLPTFTDRTGAIWRRLILMPFRATISKEERVPGRDQRGFWAKSGELPGIFLWAVEGLRRLRAQGHFTESDACAKRKSRASARRATTSSCSSPSAASSQGTRTTQSTRTHCTCITETGAFPADSGAFSARLSSARS